MELEIASQDFAFAFLLGLVPALFWLWFWLREDKKNPEPILLIIITFIAGMAVVPLALPLQKLASNLYIGANVMFIWVVIEETLKYAAALLVIFWNRAVDEPIDYIIYLIAIALGFAALENALFILNPLLLDEYTTVAVTGSFRFLGATLLHVLASSTIGICLAFGGAGDLSHEPLHECVLAGVIFIHFLGIIVQYFGNCFKNKTFI